MSGVTVAHTAPTRVGVGSNPTAPAQNLFAQFGQTSFIWPVSIMVVRTALTRKVLVRIQGRLLILMNSLQVQ